MTGTIALIWSANPSLTNDAVEQILFSTCQDLSPPGRDPTYGYGLIDAAAAVAQATATLSP